MSVSKPEHIARVYAAVENNVQPVPTAVKIEMNLASCYQEKLVIDGKTIPDPFKIPHGWLAEDEGIVFWPVVTALDIYAKLMFYPSELRSTELSDYNFKNGWMNPLLHHNLSGSRFCLM